MKNTITTLFHMFLHSVEKYNKKNAFIYRAEKEEFTVTYEKLFEDVLILARAFKEQKVKKGTKVMFLCDNRYSWIVSDLALISLGAISIPRGSDTPTQELKFIMTHAEADFLIIENENLLKKHEEMLNELKLKATFVIEAPKIHTFFDTTYSYKDLLENNTIYPEDIEEFKSRKDNLFENDLFTIIYTSGTTGTPKGVMLTHLNIMHNVRELPKFIGLTDEDLWVSILPSWHIFERAAEYLGVAKGSCTVYSTIKTFAADLEHYKPTIVATVPRLWESMYTKINNTIEKKDPKKAKLFKKLVDISIAYKKNSRLAKGHLPVYEKESFLKKIWIRSSAKIKCFFLAPLNTFAKKKLVLVQKKFGGHLRLAISGGGSLPDFIDRWIDALDIRIVNAYGMTECAPGICGRGLDCDIFGTLGTSLEGSETKIVDKEGNELPNGKVGEIWVKGPQVTPGYYKNEEENAKSFTKDGFLKTGDLGKKTLSGELVITGRSKEVIVLANGENVDPSRIESTISMLPFVNDTIVVGHNKKGLGMLIVPDFDKLKDYVQEHYDEVVLSMEHLLEHKDITNSLKRKMNELLHPKEGFKPFEKLQNIHFLDNEFAVGEELTNTMKKKRHVIEKKYKEVIDKLLH